MWEIRVEHLIKDYGALRAVDDLSFGVAPGSVTGFLGPNGAGKTTTLRCLLGLVAPSMGEARIGGLLYADLPHPARTVGASLEASSFHPGRTARNHLRTMAAAAGLADRRAEEVLEMTGLSRDADRRVGGYSTGMRQRLALASALLGDPACLVLDEPATGLDPAGINWLRQLFRHLAHDRGKTVLVSSHMLAEMEHTADRVVIIAHGRLVTEGTLDDVVRASGSRVRVRAPDLHRLRRALDGAGLPSEPSEGALVVASATSEQVGHVAYMNGLELFELSQMEPDLEDVFLEITGRAASPATSAQHSLPALSRSRP